MDAIHLHLLFSPLSPHIMEFSSIENHGVSVMSPNEYYIMGVVLTIQGILGLLFNSVLLVFLTQNSTRRPGNRLSISLCLGDMGIALMCPFAALASFKETWPYGDQGCQLYAFVGMLFGTVSITSLVSVAVDTFFSAVGNTGGWKSYLIAISAIWLNAIFWAVTPLRFVGWGRYAIEPQNTTCMLDFGAHGALYVSYLVAMMGVVYVVPMGVVTCCLKKLRGNGSDDPKKSAAKKEATMTCVLVLLSLCFYWGVYGVVALWAAADDINNVPIRLVASAPLLAKMCPIGNVVLQLLTNNSLRGYDKEGLRAADKKK